MENIKKNSQIDNAELKKQKAPNQNENEAAENEVRKAISLILRELNLLKESMEKLKETNMLFSQLAQINMSDEGETKSPSDALVKKLIRENNSYKKLAVERIKDMVFNKVKEEFPDITYGAFEEFPEEFHRLVCAQVSPVVAYKVVSGKTVDNKPKEIGKINENSEKNKEYYTSKEVDKLTKKQLSNPKIMETVLKSMQRW